MSSLKSFSHNMFFLLLFVFSASCFVFQPVNAMPLAPEIVEQLRDSGQLQKFIDRMESAKARGVCQAFDHVHKTGSRSFSSNSATVDTFNVIVILADFSDHTAADGGYSATQSDFEHLLFSNDSTDGHYSMSEFYYDNSYGNFVLNGVVSGWYRMPQTYAYYVDGQNGFGSYPTNAQRMAQDAINAADPFVDYSQFDNDNNGTIDGVFIVHSGRGAEAGGTDNDIWSHAWGIPGGMNLDGVNINSYTTEPEELYGNLSTQGVYSHEFGHFLGLPDLYDTDYSSSGLGRWSLMAGGSWNANGAYPAFFDAWCKKELGFLNLTNVTTNLTNEEIPTSYYNPTAYRIWENGTVGQEYFLVENRQKTNKDTGIPASGLLIYHIDESRGGNWDETHYLVALEQADNQFDLENGNGADGTDVWVPSTQTEFSDVSAPNSKKYNGNPTNILVWDISAADSLMYANLDVNYSSPFFTVTSSHFSDSLYGNNNGVVEVGETLTFTFSLNNAWLTATNVTGELVSDNMDISFTTSTVNIGTVVGEGGTGDNISVPFVFDIPVTYDPCIDSFYLTITSDNPLGSITVGYELQVGTPQVVIIDDDNGDTWETPLVNSLTNFKVVHDVYDKSLMGSPSSAYLNNYDIVIWFTGSDRADIFSAADYSAMQDYMDNGGNLLLTGQSVAQELSTDDITFIQNYFKAEYWSDFFYPEFIGQSGTKIGDGLKIGYDTQTNQTSPERMNLVGMDGVSEFELPIGGVSAVSYEGTYKSILMSFGLEGISSQGEGQGYATVDTLFGRILKFFDYGDVNTFSNPYVDTILFPYEFSQNSVADPAPVFAWSYADTTGASQQQYQIQVGTGNVCLNSSDMWDSGLLTGSLDSIVYAGSILQEGSTYYVRIRTYNGTEWSSWRRTTFTMNIAPQLSSLVFPIDDELVATNTPELIIENGNDGNGDVLTYDFELYADISLSTLVTSATSVAEGVGNTSWLVDVALTEDAQYFWRSRISDGSVYTNYSGTGSFYVNAVNQAPSAFGLLLPIDSVESVGTTPTFTWSSSIDNDPGEVLTYTLMYDTDELFNTATFEDALSDTTFSVGVPLDDNQTYYWKVLVYDNANDTTWSTETFKFATGAWNSAPQSGTIVSPLNESLEPSNTPTLVVNNGSDINGDALTYEFEVYSDISLMTLVASTSTVPEGVGTTSWSVDVSLAEDTKFYWRSRVTDGQLFGGYTATGTFYVNQINQSPAAFGLMNPVDSSSFVGLTPVFDWHNSSDSDPGDSIVYTLMYAIDSLFVSPIVQAVNSDTTFTIVTPLDVDMIYYWKVFATDVALDTTWSSEQFVFNTGAWGCCIGIRGNVDNDSNDVTDISDLVYLVDFMFTSGQAPECLEEANIDGDVGDIIDITDLVALVDFMFTSGSPPANCP